MPVGGVCCRIRTLPISPAAQTLPQVGRVEIENIAHVAEAARPPRFVRDHPLLGLAKQAAAPAPLVRGVALERDHGLLEHGEQQTLLRDQGRVGPEVRVELGREQRGGLELDAYTRYTRRRVASATGWCVHCATKVGCASGLIRLFKSHAIGRHRAAPLQRPREASLCDRAMTGGAAGVLYVLASRAAGRAQSKKWPPFTSSAWPVTARARSEAKNTTASAISSESGM